MTQELPTKTSSYLRKTTSQKNLEASDLLLATLPDSLEAWTLRYLQLVVQGVRSPAITQKIALHLTRFREAFATTYGHDRMSVVLQRDVRQWQDRLVSEGLAASTVNNHMASLSAFTTWVHAQSPHLFPLGDPAKGIGDLALPPLEPRALTTEQVASLKNLCDRLPRLHERRSRRAPRIGDLGDQMPMRADSRPYRDRAIIFLLLSTGLRREELVNLDLDQIEPADPTALRKARRAQIQRVRGKGKTQRTVFLSSDARTALADYLVRERPLDVTNETNKANKASEAVEANALFLSAYNRGVRKADGRLSPRAINLILQQIGRWHDADMRDPARHISPLRPHDLRHTFAFLLAQSSGKDAYELERRLGHRSQRYIQRYTNPPKHVAARYIEEF